MDREEMKDGTHQEFKKWLIGAYRGLVVFLLGMIGYFYSTSEVSRAEIVKELQKSVGRLDNNFERFNANMENVIKLSDEQKVINRDFDTRVNKLEIDVSSIKAIIGVK